MKKIIVVTILLCLTFSAQAVTGPIAEIEANRNISYKKTLIKLFSKEAKIIHSKLSDYLSALKLNPENQGYTIKDSISEADIVRLESGFTGGSYEVNYLIIIRAGYGSNVFQVGYLKAEALASEDETRPVLIRITAPTKVTIE
jgi:hypothetical protein